MAPAHVNIVKGANLLVNGPCQSTNAGRRGAEADGGEEETAAGTVGNVLVQQVAEAGFVQEEKEGCGEDRDENRQYPGAVHAQGPRLQPGAGSLVSGTTP